MTRSRASAKAAGTRFERLIADHLAEVVDDRIDRRVKTGRQGQGRHRRAPRPRPAGRRRAKDYGGQLKAGEWLGEAEVERVNDEALAGVVSPSGAARDPATRSC
jgi:hypothetical protein